MRVLAVNIRSGGNRRSAPALVSRVLGHQPDVVVFSEFRDTPTGHVLRRTLLEAGLGHQCATEGHPGNGVLVAAVEPFSALRNPFGLPDDEYPNAIVQAQLGALRILGVYLPGQDRKRPHLRCLIAMAQRTNTAGIDALAIGDFNSGRNRDDIEANARRGRLVDEFSTADLYEELESYWTETWHHLHPEKREFSWYPFRKAAPALRKNGWRIDKAFASQSLVDRVQRAEYDHGFRLEGLTDHSALVVDLESIENPEPAPLDGSNARA